VWVTSLIEKSARICSYAVLLPQRRAASIAQCLWHDRTINDDLDACVADCPDKVALTAVQVETGSPVVSTTANWP
jgi:hypothetical protein